MKLEIFFEKFELFADAPNAIAKMRELVLELAVEGKLASALPSDGAVLSVFEFRKNVAALANTLGLRSLKESEEEVEPPFDVPSHWRWMTLADVGAAQTGTTPSKTDHDAFNGDIPFIKPADILPNSIDYSNESLTRHGAESGSRLAPSGSLLMVCIGTIGKCNLIERECAFNQQINSLTPVASVDPRYLLVAARSRYFQAAAWAKSSSTTIAILNKGKWLLIPVPLPPLAEQKRIVAKVDELMALCDRLEAQQQERETQHAALARSSLARFADAPTPANLNLLFHPAYNITPADIRKSILTLAVQGKLVTQDPNDEPLKNDGSCFKKISERDDVPSEEHFAADIPQSWRWIRFEWLGDIFGGHTPSMGRADYWKGTIPWVSPKDMHVENIEGAEMHVTEKAITETRLRRVSPGSLVFVTRSGILKRTLPVVSTSVSCVVNQDLKVLTPYSAALTPFLRLMLQGHEAMILKELVKTGTTVQSVMFDEFRNKAFPIPPLAEQRRIVAKANELMALVDQLEAQLATAKTDSARLLDAVVHELLQPHAQIIPFPKAHRDRASDRAAIGCYTLRAMQSNNSFARTALAKTFYCTEAFIGLELGGSYEREAAGPLDKWIYEFERLAEREGWFSTTSETTAKGKEVTKYQLKPALQAKADQAVAVLGDQRQAFDRLLGLFGKMTTEEIEIVTTLFAVWNDALFDGKSPASDWIIREMRENWHLEKKRFSPEKLAEWLSWMRRHQLVPKGQAPRTIHQGALAF